LVELEFPATGLAFTAGFWSSLPVLVFPAWRAVFKELVDLAVITLFLGLRGIRPAPHLRLPPEVG
jgi:hypothetical protein